MGWVGGRQRPGLGSVRSTDSLGEELNEATRDRWRINLVAETRITFHQIEKVKNTLQRLQVYPTTKGTHGLILRWWAKPRNHRMVRHLLKPNKRKEHEGIILIFLKYYLTPLAKAQSPADVPYSSFLSASQLLLPFCKRPSALAQGNHTDCLGRPLPCQIYIRVCQECPAPASPYIFIFPVLQGPAEISPLLESLLSSSTFKGISSFPAF